MGFPSLFSVEDKVAFVTGAGSGLGTEFAQIMAEAGADVVCTDIARLRLHDRADPGHGRRMPGQVTGTTARRSAGRT